MDESDLQILRILLLNSRIPYRELAERIGLSVGAVHKRVQSLIDIGTIQVFIARPSIAALKGIFVTIWGTSKAKSMDDVSIKLGENENCYFVGILSNKFLHTAGFLRNISELHPYSTFIVKTGKIENPTIGIIEVPYQLMPETLKMIDYKILKALNRDARKPIANFADEVGLSAKTVKKAIDRMMTNHLVNFTIEFSPRSENDFITVFYITLHEDSKLQMVVKELNDKFSKNIIYIRTYSNIPYFLTMHTWAKSAGEMQKIQEELQKEGFKDIVPRIMLFGYYFDCWLDHILIKK